MWLTGGDNNVFVQVGLVVLMGLACKNAILIVEFARELEMQGKGIVEAALEACRLRLRPIVMTSIAFIAGTIPLILGHGAGAEVRGVTGITVFSGMLGVTLFGLFLTPVFYVTLRRLVARKSAAADRLNAALKCKKVGHCPTFLCMRSAIICRRFQPLARRRIPRRRACRPAPAQPASRPRYGAPAPRAKPAPLRSPPI